MEKIKRVSKKRNNRWAILAIFSFFISLFCVSAWFVSNAWFRDRDDMMNDVDTAAIQLENNSHYSMSTVVNLALADQYLLEDDITFNITEKSSEVYVRCAIKFSCTDGAAVAKDMIKFQDFELGTNNGYSWQQFGEYFYLCDQTGVPKRIERSQAGQVFTFVEKDKLLLPRDAIVGKHFTSSDNVLMTIEVEAIQGRNLEDSSIHDLDQYFLGAIPTDTYSIIFHDTDGSVISEQSASYGGHAAIPEIDKVKSTEHKTFAYWSTTEDGDGLKIREADEDRIFSNISQNMEVWPFYAHDQVQITVIQSEGGTITPGSTTVDWGTGKTFRVVADSGHEISQIKRDGVVIYDFTGSKLDMFDYVLENVVVDTQIEAVFSPVVYDITVITVGNGTVSPGSTTAVFGTSKVFTLTPDEGYRIWSINLDGVDEAVTAASGASQRYTLSNISSDHILSVNFVRSVLQITTVAGANGTIRPAELEVEYNSFASVSIVPNEGYEIASIYVDDKALSEVSKGGVAQNISFENVVEDHVVRAYFSIIKLHITASAGDGGSISPNDPSGEIEYNYGTSASFDITPDAQMTIDQIFVDGAEVAVTVTEGSKQTYTFDNLKDSHSIYVTFKRALIKLDINGGSGNQPTITYSLDGTKFTLSNIEPTGPSGKEFYYYSTRAYDDEKGQLGDRYDLGYEYDVPDLDKTTTLYAIYLTPTQDLTVYSAYMVFPKGTVSIERLGLQEAIEEVMGSGNQLAQIFGILIVLSLSTSQSDTNLIYCTLPAGLNSLNWYAFCGCSSLTGVSVPASLSSIGMSAFANTPSLKSFTIPYTCVSIGQSAFQDSGVSEIKTNNKLQSIGAYAFKNSGITEFKVPRTVTKMGETDSTFSDEAGFVDGVFANCSNLEKVDFSEQSSFHGQTFKNCTSLTQVILPKPLTSIPDSQFEGCSSLSSVSYINDSGELINKFPSTLKSIGANAFYGCNFNSLLLDDCSKVLIGDSAFVDNAFSSLTLTDEKIKSVGEGAFSSCAALLNLSWQLELEIPSNCFAYCVSLQSVNISKLKNSIGEYSFASCSVLSGVTISINSSNFSILEGAFQNCAISTITLPEGLVGIDSLAFYGNKFEDITFPASLSYLADDALQNCVSLTKFTLKSDLESNITNTSKVGNGGPWYVEGEPYVVGHERSSAPDGIGPKATYTTTPGKAKNVDWNWVEILANGQIRTYTSSATASTTTSSTSSKTYDGVEVGKKYLIKYIPASLDEGDLTITAPTAIIDFNGQIHEIAGIIAFDTNDVAKTKISSSNNVYLELPSGFEYVGAECFNNVQGKALDSITISRTIKYVGKNAFNGTKISSVYLPNLTFVGESAFENCSELKSAEFSNLITQIPYACFKNSGVANFVMPQSVQAIGESAFESSSITKVYLPATCLEIGAKAFYGCINLNSVEGLSNTKLTKIESQTFQNCSSLTKAYLPSTIEVVNENAFANCSQLKYVTLGSSLKTLGASVFSGCSTLQNIEFPDTLIALGANVFNGCSNLIKATFKHSSMTSSTLSAGSNSFNGTPSTLCVYIQGAISLSNFKSIFDGKGFAEKATLYYQGEKNPLANYISGVWKQMFTIKIVCGEGGNVNAKFGSDAEILVQSNQTKTFYIVSGTSYTLTIIPDTTTTFYALLVDGQKVSVQNDSTNSNNKKYTSTVSAAATLQATFDKPVVYLDANGANGTNYVKHTITEGSNKESFKINDDATNYTKNGKPFYFYSTVSSDNESTQVGKRFDVGVTYSISTLSGLKSNILYAIYLTPTAESNFNFSNGTISLKDKNTTITNLVIPQTINGTKVTAIGACGFTSASASGKISSTSTTLSGLITMPSSITTIGARAFAGNSNISGTFSLPYNLTNLGDEAFAWCRESSININVMNPSSQVVKFIADQDATDRGILYTKGGVYQLALQSSYSKTVDSLDATTIMPHAFATSRITEFDDNNKITKYGNYAFADCGSLTTIKFKKSASAVTFGTGVFSGTTSKLKIYVPKNDVDNYIKKLNSSMEFQNGALIYNGLDATIPYAQYYEGSWRKIYKVVTEIEGKGGTSIKITNKSAETNSQTFTFNNYKDAFGESITGTSTSNCDYGYYREDWALSVIITSNLNEGYVLKSLKVNSTEQTIQQAKFNKVGNEYTFDIAANQRTEDWTITATFEKRTQNVEVYVDDNLKTKTFSLVMTQGSKQTSGDFAGYTPYSCSIVYGNNFKITDITPNDLYIIKSFKYRKKVLSSDGTSWTWESDWTFVDIKTKWSSSASGAFNSITNQLFSIQNDIQIVITTQYSPFIVKLSSGYLPMGMQYNSTKDQYQYEFMSGISATSTGATSVAIPESYEGDKQGNASFYYFMNNKKRFDTGISYTISGNFVATNAYYILKAKYFVPISSGFTKSGTTLTINGDIKQGTNLAIPKDVTTVTIASSEYGKYQISYLQLPKTVTTIECGAFAKSSITGDVYLPTNLKTIKEGALTTTGAAKFNQTRVGSGYGFDISGDNTYLTTNSGKTLITANSSITLSSIPSGVTKLGAYLFAGRTYGSYTDANNSVTSYGVGVFFDTSITDLTFTRSSSNVSFDGKFVNSTKKSIVKVSDGDYMTKLNGRGFMSYDSNPNKKSNPFTSMYLLSGDTSLYAIYYSDTWHRVYFYTHNTNVNTFTFASNNTANEFYDNNDASRVYVKNNTLSYSVTGINDFAIQKVEYFKYVNGVKSTTATMTNSNFDLHETGETYSLGDYNMETTFGGSVHIEISTDSIVFAVTIIFDGSVIDNEFMSSYLSLTGKNLSDIFKVEKKTTNKDSIYSEVSQISDRVFTFMANYKSEVEIKISSRITNSIFTLGANGDNSSTSTLYIDGEKTVSAMFKILPIKLDVNYGTSKKGNDNNLTYLINTTAIKQSNSSFSYYFSISDPDLNLSLNSAECYYFSNSSTAVDFSDERYDFGLTYKVDFDVNNLTRTTLYARYAKASSDWNLSNGIQYVGTGASGTFYSGSTAVTSNILVMPKSVQGNLFESISTSTFANNLTNVKYILFPGSCVELVDNFFAKSSSIEKIQLPSNFTIKANATPFKDLTICKYVSISNCYNGETLTIANNYISHNGAVYNVYESTLIYHPEKLSVSQNTIISNTITTIASYACQNCSEGSFSNITFSSLVRISSYAFENCTIMTSFNDNKTPELKYIDDYAFKNSLLKTLKISSASVQLGEGAFYNCTKLEGTLYIGVTTMGDKVFANDSYPSSLTTNQKALSFQFDNLTALGDETFKNSYVNKLIFSDNFADYWIDSDGKIVEEISLSYDEGDTIADVINAHVKVNYGSSNFDGCDNLTAVYGWSSLKDLSSIYSKEEIFRDCPLDIITFNDNAKYVGAFSLSLKPTLNSVKFGDNIAAIGDSAFYGDSITNDGDWIANIIYVGEHAFQFNSFAELDFSKSTKLHMIDEYAFANCIKLENVSFPNCIKSVKSKAFDRCTKLRKVQALYGMMTAINEFKTKEIGGLTFSVNIDDGKPGGVLDNYGSIGGGVSANNKLGEFIGNLIVGGFYLSAVSINETLNKSYRCAYFEEYVFLHCGESSIDSFQIQVVDQSTYDFTDEKNADLAIQLKLLWAIERYFSNAGYLFRKSNNGEKGSEVITINYTNKYTIDYTNENTMREWTELS